MTVPEVACVFCGIAAGEVPAEIVAKSERATAFRDLNPQAPVHALVIPNAHYANVADLAGADPKLLAELVQLAAQVANENTGGEYRLVFNSGTEAGQSVFHTHGHVIGGVRLGWNPA